ncbi:Endonuclease/exonuclease/phosphatase, partial [Earliella scabrosa]
MRVAGAGAEASATTTSSSNDSSAAYGRGLPIPGGRGESQTAEQALNNVRNENGVRTNENRHAEKRKEVRTRATIKIGSLNMRGSGDVAGSGSKWLYMNQVVRDGKIAVLAVQETHITERKATELNSLFQASLKVIVSPDPTNPTGARGVALVLNKRLIQADEVKVEVMIPGRAIYAIVPWSRGTKFTLLAIYAPNERGENAQFWKTLEEKLGTRVVDVMTGDFNVVESAIDRLPMREDDTSAVEALKDLCACKHLKDEWRARNEQERMYTYRQSATGSMSRIDRIYLNDRIRGGATEWETKPPGFLTDHSLTTSTIVNRHMPFVGRGRWRMHNMLLDDKEFMEEVKERGIKLQATMSGVIQRDEVVNVQTLFAHFKDEIKALAKDRAKKRVPKMDKRLARLREDLAKMLTQLQANQQTDEAQQERTKERVGVLQEKIEELEMKRFGRKREAVAARDWIEGETMSKYWMRTN